MALTVIQEGILTAYTSIIKRIRDWLLPLILLLLLVSAYGRFNPLVLTYVSAIELTSLHFYLGWLLTLIWLILVYDVIFSLLTESTPRESPHAASGDRLQSGNGLTRLVNSVFYILLLLVCLSGLLKYGMMRMPSYFERLNHLDASLVHIVLGWLFISTALIKYYLSVTRWLLNLLRYLRED